MFKIAILASTNGTDLQAIIDEQKAGKLKGIEIACVISNKNTSLAYKRAKEQGLNTIFIPSLGKNREEFDREIVKTLKEHHVQLVCLVGFMRILSQYFIDEYRNRIINVHPSLIPKYCGKEHFGTNVHTSVLANDEIESGMTIHYVDEGVDTGDIIVQKKCKVSPYDTVDTLKDKVQALEKKWYPEVIRQIAKKSKESYFYPLRIS